MALAWFLVATPALARFASGTSGLRMTLVRWRRALASRRALGALLVLPFAAVAAILFARGGAPAPNPADQRSATLERARQEAPHDLNTAVAQLEARLAKEPDDADGWRLLARSYDLLGETEKSAAATRRAAALGGGDSTASKSADAEAMVTAANGRIGPEALKLFEAALADDPKDPRARFFLGLAKAQGGDNDEALQRWLALEADAPPDAAWLEGLRANIARLAGAMGLSDDELARRRSALAGAAPPAAPGPSTADVAAAASMSADDRTAMIKSMVQRLADRLAQQPGDVDGWLRLGRAYSVLGEPEKSVDAFRHASEADPKRDDARAAYEGALAAHGPAK